MEKFYYTCIDRDNCKADLIDWNVESMEKESFFLACPACPITGEIPLQLQAWQ